MRLGAGGDRAKQRRTRRPGLSGEQGLISNRQEGTFGGNTAVLNYGDSCTTL